jgi:hypothetical protein
MPQYECCQGACKDAESYHNLNSFQYLMKYHQQIGTQFALAIGACSAVSGSTRKMGKKMLYCGKQFPKFRDSTSQFSGIEMRGKTYNKLELRIKCKFIYMALNLPKRLEGLF